MSDLRINLLQGLNEICHFYHSSGHASYNKHSKEASHFMTAVVNHPYWLLKALTALGVLP